MKEIDPANASYDDLFTFVTNMLEVRHQLFVLPTMTEVAFNVPRWDGRAREVALLWRLTKRGNYAE